MKIKSKVSNNSLFPKNYILFVGKRNGYKNFNIFIESITPLFDDNLDLTVVCVGGGEFNNQELELFEELTIKEKVFQFNLDDNTLAQCYSNALLFVFPSLYEGFGIPILESFSSSCPLVCSNTSSFPEVAEEGAVYFDPSSKESIYNSVKQVLDSKDERDRLIKNGQERLKYFSWEKAVHETNKVYRNILK